MTLNPQFSDGDIEASVNAMAALRNGGFLEIYNGAQPTDANTALSGQTLLATLTFGNPAFGSATAAGAPGSRIVTAVANAITGANAVATGTATWFRCYQSNGTTIDGDGTVGTGTNDLVLNTTSLVSGVPVAVVSFQLTEAEN